LTGDAALDWIANAGPTILSQELSGGTHVLPLRVSSTGIAALANATQLLHCTFTQRGGSLQIQYALEDAERHRMITTGSIDGTALFAVSALRGLSTLTARVHFRRRIRMRRQPGDAVSLSGR
jgi:hypothetical protein